jgi:nucleotide-binding universal stress UspA family protein
MIKDVYKMKSNLPPVFGTEKILVAVDGSETSMRAVHYGNMFAGNSGAQLILLHVVQPPGFFGTSRSSTISVPSDSNLESHKKKSIEKAEKWIAKLASSITIESAKLKTQILDDSASSVAGAIVGYANQHRVDLIIVGNRGRGGFKGLIVDSLSQQIVDKAKCKVLVIK